MEIHKVRVCFRDSARPVEVYVDVRNTCVGAVKLSSVHVDVRNSCVGAVKLSSVQYSSSTVQYVCLGHCSLDKLLYRHLVVFGGTTMAMC